MDPVASVRKKRVYIHLTSNLLHAKSTAKKYMMFFSLEKFLIMRTLNLM